MMQMIHVYQLCTIIFRLTSLQPEITAYNVTRKSSSRVSIISSPFRVEVKHYILKLLMVQ